MQMVMIGYIKKWVPLTYDAFVKNRIKLFTLSSEGIEFIKSQLKNKNIFSKKNFKRELENLKIFLIFII